MLLGLEINNTFLEIEGSIRLEIINEIFSVDVYQDDWSFPFKLFDTPVNRIALGFSNLPETAGKVLEYSANIYIGTEKKGRGKLIIQAAGNNFFNVSICSGLKALPNANKKLKDLAFINPDTGDNSVEIPDSEDLGVLQTVDYENAVAFPPHQNEAFYNDNPHFGGIVNRQNAATGFYKNNDFNTHNVDTMVPWVYLFFIIDTILKELGLTGKGSFYESAEERSALLYNNKSLDDPMQHWCYGNHVPYNFPLWPPAVFFTILIDPATDPFSLISSSQFHAPTDGEYHLKHIVMANYAEGAPGATSFNVDAVFWNNTTSTILYTQSIVFPANSIHVEEIETIVDLNAGDDISVRYYPTFGPASTSAELQFTDVQFIIQRLEDIAYVKDSFLINDHVPDLTVAELFAQLKLRKPLKYTFDFDQGTMSMDYVTDVTSKRPVEDISDKISAKYEILFGETEKGFTIGYDFGDTDQLVEGNFKSYNPDLFLGAVDKIGSRPAPTAEGQSVLVNNLNVIYFSITYTGAAYTWGTFTDNYYDIVVGTGEKEAKCKLAPMFMRLALNDGSGTQQRTALMPAIKEAGSSVMFDQGENTPSIRLMYLRGINPDSTYGGIYLLASSTPIAVNGDTAGTEYLKMNDQNGIYISYHETLIQALVASEIIERDIYLDQGLLASGRLKEKLFAHNMNLLLKSASVPIEGNNIRISKGRFIRV